MGIARREGAGRPANPEKSSVSGSPAVMAAVATAAARREEGGKWRTGNGLGLLGALVRGVGERK